MKKLLFILLFLFPIYVFPQSGFFTWINHTPNELIKSKGKPVQITKRNNDSLYIYQTQLGYTSFVVKKGKVVKTNNTTYWKVKEKAKDAFKLLLKFYKKDGFTTETNNEEIVTLSNSRYDIKVEMYYSEEHYAVSETALAKVEALIK